MEQNTKGQTETRQMAIRLILWGGENEVRTLKCRHGKQNAIDTSKMVSVIQSLKNVTYKYISS